MNDICRLLNLQSTFSRVLQCSAEVLAWYSSFHSLLLCSGSLKSFGLSFMARWTVLPYLAVEQGFSEEQVTIAAGKDDFGAFELCSPFGRFCAVPAHGMAFPAYRDTVIADGEVILIYRRSSPVGIEVNEGNNPMATAVFIVRHGIMCRVQKQLRDFCFWKELRHGEPVIKKHDGVMVGSGTEKREHGQVAVRIRGGGHIQAITKIVAFPVGVPSDVTVRLAVDAVTPAVADAVFYAVAGMFFPFPCGSADRGAVPRKREAGKIKQSTHSTEWLRKSALKMS